MESTFEQLDDAALVAVIDAAVSALTDDRVRLQNGKQRLQLLVDAHFGRLRQPLGSSSALVRTGSEGAHEVPRTLPSGLSIAAGSSVVFTGATESTAPRSPAPAGALERWGNRPPGALDRVRYALARACR